MNWCGSVSPVAFAVVAATRGTSRLINCFVLHIANSIQPAFGMQQRAKKRIVSTIVCSNYLHSMQWLVGS
jgi:hypothetical protein|eukprot:COSAG01_NODE_203_length_22128_cov_280.658359_6_plen_70_part_00